MKALHLKRTLIASVIVPASLGLVVGGAAYAAGGEKATTTQQQGAKAEDKATQMRAAKDIRASELIGMEVTNAQDENLGEIQDVIVDVNNERVHYVVLAFGGALGLGEKLFAYPVKTFKQGAEEDKLVLNVDKERLDKAPGFERDKWPDWDKDEYRGNVDEYFGPTVTLKQMPNQKLVRASEVIGRNVDDTAGRDAGEIKDLVINLANGKVHYAVLDVDASVGRDDVLVPISLTTFKFPTGDRDDIVLNIPRDKIDLDVGFTEDDWPDFGAPGYEGDMNRRLRGAS